VCAVRSMATIAPEGTPDGKVIYWGCYEADIDKSADSVWAFIADLPTNGAWLIQPEVMNPPPRRRREEWKKVLLPQTQRM
jgi:hypothetical protein